MNFPRCEKCRISLKWTLLKTEQIRGSTIDFYKCASCGYDMSWSYTQPEQKLVEER